ncbi:hypothetical protein EVAR_87836_1 [Eumeta japonica]|uniref:Uncharacterized protein n=1 Tax=Eumeta variegata TaxID=151549 RepID=A0A4C1YC63_EUMVA|nr:hypothetical protein EVAR_87836_1 [Eumeta japonica]
MRKPRSNFSGMKSRLSSFDRNNKQLILPYPKGGSSLRVKRGHTYEVVRTGSNSIIIVRQRPRSRGRAMTTMASVDPPPPCPYK